MRQKSLPPKTKTVPQTFIIESLTFDDETSGRQDGRLLRDVLQLYGKKPKYVYCRTEKELKELAGQFRASGYRYLHISCHGDDANFAFTLDSISYRRFADIFNEKLDNRRLFISGCDLVTDALAASVFGTNRGMYSLIGPNTQITFKQSVAFWSAFYYRMDYYTHSSMKKVPLRTELRRLCDMFETNISYYWANTGTGRVDSEKFSQLPDR